MRTEKWLLKHPNTGILILTGFFLMLLLIGWYIGEYNPKVEGWM